MQKLKNLFRQTILYSILHGIEALVPFLFVMLLTRYMTPEEYGIWSLFASLYAFTMPWIGARLDDAVRMHFSDLNRAHLSKFVSTSLFVTTFLALFAGIVVTTFSESFAQITKFPERWLWTIILVAYLYSIFNILRSVYQFQEQLKPLAVALVMQVVMTLVITAIFLEMGSRYVAAIFGTAAGAAAIIAFSIAVLKPFLDINIFTKLDRKFLLLLLKFFVLYLPAALGPVIVIVTDRLFIAHMEGISETGFYAIASMFGSVVTTIIAGGFLFAWLPWVFRRLKQGDTESRHTAFIATLLFYIGLPVAGLIIWQLALWVAPYLMGEQFLQAADYIFWLIMAAVVQSYFLHNQGFLHFAKRTKTMSACVFITIIVNIVCDYLFIKEYGTIGIAYATIAAYGSAALLNGILAIMLVKRKHITAYEDQ